MQVTCMAFTHDEIVEYVTETNSAKTDADSDEGTKEMVENITLQEGQKLLERSLLFLEQHDTDFGIDSNELLTMRRLLRKTTDYRYSKKRQAYITSFISDH